MIYVRLMGGLGNQMFQYAAGKALSTKHKTGLVIDTSFLVRDPKGHYVKRPYELSAFRCQAAVASKIQQLLLKSAKYTSKFMPKGLPEIAIENKFEYNEQFETIGKSTILIGYWQSERYFKHIRDTLLEELQPAAALSNAAKQYAENIAGAQNSVSLHFRRGDYVSLKSASNVHGTASIEYYANAVKLITEKTGRGNFFVFSDEIEWVKDNFPLSDATYVSGLSGIEDMHLMSKCRNNIIANSSFSWWAAWLNNNSNKTVVAPRQWFADATIDTKDLIPKAWIRI
jgi:hypothetical protein